MKAHIVGYIWLQVSCIMTDSIESNSKHVVYTFQATAVVSKKAQISESPAWKDLEVCHSIFPELLIVKFYVFR